MKPVLLYSDISLNKRMRIKGDSKFPNELGLNLINLNTKEENLKKLIKFKTLKSLNHISMNFY